MTAIVTAQLGAITVLAWVLWGAAVVLSCNVRRPRP